MENKNKDRFRMGGGPTPSDLLLPEEEMKKISENPWNFILAIPLAPHHNLYDLSREELVRLETLVKGPSNHPLNRSLKGNVVKWLVKATRKDPLWTSPRPIESVSSFKNFYILGGEGSFWPLPLKREGLCSARQWKATLPDSFSTTWLISMEHEITKRWKGLFWTLSER